MIDGETFFAFTKNTLIGYTGASYHTTNNDEGMFHAKVINEMVQGSLRQMKAMKLGKKMVQVKQVDGTIKTVALYHVKFYAVVKVNLLSLTTFLSQCSIFAKDMKIILCY